MSNIPKIIHYCWFGKNDLPENVKKNIDVWKKMCPDYTIMQWNENNFNIECNDFVKEAYKTKKWAFVSDYVRLYALYEYGGIYMDTDVELVKNLDPFLNDNVFFGFESNKTISTAVIGSKEKNNFIKKILDTYEEKHLLLSDGTIDNTPNVILITNLLKKVYGKKILEKNDRNDVTIYPFDYLCAKEFRTGKLMVTSNTYAIHHFEGTWLSDSDKKLNDMQVKINNKFGLRLGGYIFKLYKFIFIIKVYGFKVLINNIIRKLKRS